MAELSSIEHVKPKYWWAAGVLLVAVVVARAFKQTVSPTTNSAAEKVIPFAQAGGLVSHAGTFSAPDAEGINAGSEAGSAALNAQSRAAMIAAGNTNNYQYIDPQSGETEQRWANTAIVYIPGVQEWTTAYAPNVPSQDSPNPLPMNNAPPVAVTESNGTVVNVTKVAISSAGIQVQNLASGFTSAGSNQTVEFPPGTNQGWASSENALAQILLAGGSFQQAAAVATAPVSAGWLLSPTSLGGGPPPV